MKLTRRQFIAGAGALVASAAQVARAGDQRRVLVLGAGLAGLSAAVELARRGFSVTVIEGRDRVGGRVVTLRDPFLGGQYVELGGELIGDGYKRMIGYLKALNVPFEEVPSAFETGGSVSTLKTGTGTTAIMKGRLFPVGTVFDPHPYGLKGPEAAGLPPTLLATHVRALAQEVAKAPESMRDLDRMSLAGVLRKRGVTDEAIRLMNVSLNYNSIETVSAAGVLFDARRRIGAGTKAVRIVGGNDGLVKALHSAAVAAGAKFILGSRIRRIERNGATVSVTFAGPRGKPRTLTAEKTVCTIPFSVLRDIEFTPALPAEKSAAIRELPYTHITKVFMQSKRSEWDRRSISTSIWTDTPLERIFEMAGVRGGDRGIFTAWMDGDGAAMAERLSDKARIAWAKTEFVRALPFMKGMIERSATKSWTNDEFVRGSYAHFAVGHVTGLKPHVKTAVGNIHFAGEHTAELSPGMEGALESAERVVKEIAG